ncbi:MAG: type II toxin-antitoxin system VapC family toxin [Candidatus Aenigmarchaeota archaeon]|nr:type II toxin-antitoxin system VapC family toxin [Candidatus Aenigmarchaeota archaeon]
MIYVDSNIFISAVLYGDAGAQKAKSLLIEIAEGRMPAYTSTLTWDELVWAISKLSGKEKANVEGRKFMEFPNLRFVPADFQIISEAQRLMEKYGIRPRDAIHASSALSKGLNKMVSEDADFDSIREIKRISLQKG